MKIALRLLGQDSKERRGTFGAFGTLSFYPAKVLGCFGDGGAVMSPDTKVVEKLELLRDHGRNQDGLVVDWGTNSRLDNLQAAFLKHRLAHYKEDMEYRRHIAARYHTAFCNHSQISVPPGPSEGDHFDVYQNYEMAVERRDELRSWLADRGIKTIVQWAGTPVHHFEALGYGIEKFTDLPRVDWFFERCIMLPIHMALSSDDVDYIIEQVLAFFESE